MSAENSSVFPASAGLAFAETVEQTLAEYFARRRGADADIGPEFIEAVAELEQFVLRGGKRTRPAFAWAGWLGSGGDPDGAQGAAVLQVCAALELVQACALIHDDIIDASDTRRRFPTVHVAFARRHRERGWAGDAQRYGHGVAILLGDLALAWADDMVNAADLEHAARERLTPVWAAMRTEVLGGQLLDITGEACGEEAVEAAMRINRYKTAAYTVERPLHIGAALAGADDALVGAFRTFGTDIGVAFQLRDDLLGVFGDPAVTGKPSGDDLRTGKRTALLAVALAHADVYDPAAAQLLRTTVGTPLTDDDVATLRAAITDIGAVADIERRITELTESAFAALDASSATAEAKSRLREMAIAATKRTW